MDILNSLVAHIPVHSPQLNGFKEGLKPIVADPNVNPDTVKKAQVTHDFYSSPVAFPFQQKRSPNRLLVRKAPASPTQCIIMIHDRRSHDTDQIALYEKKGQLWQLGGEGSCFFSLSAGHVMANVFI
ncbi:unnamed protein product [Linum trigynum]|uniref:Uncharacterized protein n=1 Tax=Linum trigynum TaxID=586398 RepID=A0AAV2DNH7_9ROSI